MCLDAPRHISTCPDSCSDLHLDLRRDHAPSRHPRAPAQGTTRPAPSAVPPHAPTSRFMRR
ncbi:conserved hypothetical protein [Burkholderia pseudomallei Pakistan 9]|nr:conserved hypothetical protein [Burkholderia pseudomallei Pakistan 9]